MTKLEIDKLWTKMLEILHHSFANTTIYENCIAPSQIVKIVGQNIYVSVTSIFAKSILANDCKDQINEFFENQLNKQFNFVYILPEEKSLVNINDAIVSSNEITFNHDNGLVKEYTLENFVVGEFNKSAYNAICSICRNLGTIYNPLFIYGQTGLGKTHLIMGLGNLYVKEHPNKKVKYIDSNEFTRQVFSALSKGSNFIEDLKREYSQVDLLLIDDIQYLAGKDKTNEIFFNIFNALVKSRKQIIITSDKNPEYLDSLEERMVSRFSSGLTLKIEYPEAEAIKRIIFQRIKQQEATFIFQDNAIEEIVKYYNHDLRKLIGILNKISFYAIQNLKPEEIITRDFIQKFINDTNTQILHGIDFNPDLIISTICKSYGVKEDLVKSKSRLKSLTSVRHICMYILRNKYNMPLSDIGACFSNRDHTTVINGVDNVSKMIEKDDDLKKFIDQIVNKM